MSYSIHDKINANVCLVSWRKAPETTVNQRYQKRMMISFFMGVKRNSKQAE